MPKLKNVLGAEDQFNLLISLIGLVNTQEPISVTDAAAALNVSPEQIRKAVSTIVVAGDETKGLWGQPFNFDPDAYLDDDVLAWNQNDLFAEAPKISVRQAAAIVAGLSYLKSTTAFAAESELDALIDLMSQDQPANVAPTIRFEYGSVGADIELVRKAIVSGSRIVCNYTNQRGEQSDRELDPLRLEPTGAYWYLKAWCPKNEEVREFRLDRMRAISISESPRSNQAQSIAENLDELDDRHYLPGESDIEVTLEVEPEAYELVAEFATLEEPKAIGNGVIRVQIKVGYLPNLGHLIARYAGAARVIEPANAREIVKNYALSALGEEPVYQKIANED